MMRRILNNIQTFRKELGIAWREMDHIQRRFFILMFVSMTLPVLGIMYFGFLGAFVGFLAIMGTSMSSNIYEEARKQRLETETSLDLTFNSMYHDLKKMESL